MCCIRTATCIVIYIVLSHTFYWLLCCVGCSVVMKKCVTRRMIIEHFIPQIVCRGGKRECVCVCVCMCMCVCVLICVLTCLYVCLSTATKRRRSGAVVSWVLASSIWWGKNSTSRAEGEVCLLATCTTVTYSIHVLYNKISYLCKMSGHGQHWQNFDEST